MNTKGVSDMVDDKLPCSLYSNREVHISSHRTTYATSLAKEVA
jgi:hypothetical protein